MGRRGKRAAAALVCAGAVGYGALVGGGSGTAHASGAARPATRAAGAATDNAEVAKLIHENVALSAGSTRPRVVALTFDDGPGPYTKEVVATLRRLKAPATFFEIGEQIAGYRKLVANMVKFGFVIGDHTWTHPDLELLSNAQVTDQIVWTKHLITSITGERVQFMRPPYGDQDARIRTLAGRQGLVTTLWSVDTQDWTVPGTKAIVQRALAARPGQIVIMHDGGGNRAETVAAIPAIVAGLRARGFRLVTLPQLLELAPPAAHG